MNRPSGDPCRAYGSPAVSFVNTDRGVLCSWEGVATGESIPVEKAPGGRAFAGTLNRAGTLDIRATQVGSGTTLGTIIRLVEEAQRSAAPVQRLANRYTQFYAPIAFGLAAVVYFLPP